MRTFLACSGIDGRADAVDRLEAVARQRNPDAILFAGGLFAPAAADESPTASAARRHHDMQLLEQFFAALGATRTVAAVIPGPTDVPLRAFLMAGMHARSQSAGVHVVHCIMVTSRDVVISGVGGQLTHVEDSGEPVVRCSRTTAEYFLQAFGAAAESEKVLLLGSAPQGALGGEAGNAIAGDLLDSYHPKLCIVAGPHEHRGIARVARTTVVNPGSLSDGAAAWIDWSRDVDEQVEMIRAHPPKDFSAPVTPSVRGTYPSIVIGSSPSTKWLDHREDIMNRQVTHIISCFVSLVVAFSMTQSAFALRKHGTWDKTTRAQPDAEAGGWFINLGITGGRAKILPEAPKILEVAYVFQKTPAFGKLEVGDKIVGANRKPFTEAHKFGYGPAFFGYEGPMMDFGNALEESQVELSSELMLDVIRGDERILVVLTLPTKYGAFSKTYPYKCRKTEMILDELYAYLLKKQRPDGTWHGRPHINAFAALALLGSGDEAHLPPARLAAEACARATSDEISYRGLDCWKYSLYGAYLSEYYLITREAWVISELDQINQWLHKAQMENGGWGHRPANRPGGNGYGAINVITMQAKMAWALMQRCGLEVDAEKYQAAHDFVARGTNKIGYVWYKDGGKNKPSFADMGRTGASAVAHYLSPVGGETYTDFAKLNARCIGNNPTTFPDTHGSPLLGMVWTALGALPEPAMFRQLMDHNRWHFALAQCPDGTFYYQPNRDNNPQDFAADPRLCASAVTALILSAKHQRLQMTGAKLITVE